MQRLFDQVIRFARRLRPGRNPLARTSDRIEAGLLIALVTGTLLTVPIAAAVGSENYSDTLSRITRDQANRHLTNAILLEEAPNPVISSDGTGAITQSSAADARWVDSRGTSHTGIVLAPPGSAVGTAVPLWVDGAGVQTTAPLAPSDVAVDSVLLALGLWLAVSGLLGLGYGIGRRRLDRRRAVAWERAWAEHPKHNSWP